MIKYFYIGAIMLFVQVQPQTETTLIQADDPAPQSLVISDYERFSLPEGEIKEQHNDRPLYAGMVKRGKLHDEWKSWYQNGHLCDSGRFVNGLPEGEWKHWNQKGELVAIRNYNADKYKRITNELVRYNPRRVAYPLTVMFHKDRRSASKYLHASYSFPHHVRRIDDLTLQQWVVANITEGNSYNPVFDQSLHHGLYQNFFPGGITRDSGYYKNGLRNGVWMHRDAPSGKKHVGNYTNGVRTHEWRTYDANGRITDIVFYNKKGVQGWKKSFRK